MRVGIALITACAHGKPARSLLKVIGTLLIITGTSINVVGALFMLIDI